MRYDHIRPAVFLSRPNRFIAEIEVNGIPTRAHVRNTGRCRELLLPGSDIYVQEHLEQQSRKTAFSLISVKKGKRLINMDSQAPNAVWEEALKTGFAVPDWGTAIVYRREVIFGESRLDFWVQGAFGEGYMEIKGVTLDEDGVARFPDAPTERGKKHLLELTRAVSLGLHAAVVFIIQMQEIRHFEPNRRTDPAFSKALADAERAGVNILAYSCSVTPDSLILDQTVPVCL